MQIVGYVLAILGSIAAIVAGWYLKKLLMSFVQRYRNGVNEKALEEARKQAIIDNQKANAESDKLKKIDGR